MVIRQRWKSLAMKAAKPKNIKSKKNIYEGRFKYFAFGVVAAFLVVSINQGYLFLKSLPSPRLIGLVNYPVSSKIYDRNGVLLYEDFNEQNRTPVELKDLPDYLVKATIAVEDKDFYNHRGISLVGGVLRAIKDMAAKKSLQGGSTITQQLIKTSLLTPERTIERKVKEAFLAVWAERIYTKDQILTMYLNQVPYGGTAYGVEEAAQMYFDKKASELNLSESAFLAGIPQAPTLYSPYTNKDLSQNRRDEVLKSMLSLKFISETEYKEAKMSKLIVKQPLMLIRAPHFVFYVKSLLASQYGARRVEEGGLRITTSIDIDLQEEAERIVQAELAKVTHLNVTNGAVLITSPKTGEILAMVGSKNYFDEPYGAFNVTTAPRQPGSSIKPLMYSLALERGFSAATVIEDSPVIYRTPGSASFKPVNYDNRYHGKVSLRTALANSYNIPAVKVLYQIGVGDFIKHATKLGITTWTDPSRYGLSLTLGGGEVTMTDMAVAYGTFANQGKKVPLNPILKVENYQGELLYKAPSFAQSTSVISPQNAFIISDILSDNNARRQAFGQNSLLEIGGTKVAVKTGTTNDKRDNWTAGFTPRYVAIVWVGNNNNAPMNRLLTSGITGAAPIWNQVMKAVLQSNIKLNLKTALSNKFEEPEGIYKKRCRGGFEYFTSAKDEKTVCWEGLVSPTP